MLFNILKESYEPLTALNEQSLEKCIELENRLVAFFRSVWYAHHNAPDWMAHLDWKQIYEDLIDNIDDCNEIIFMSRNQSTNLIPKPEYFAEIDGLQRLIKELLRVCNEVAELNISEGVVSFVDSLSQDLEKYAGWNFLSLVDNKKVESEKPETSEDSEETEERSTERTIINLDK